MVDAYVIGCGLPAFAAALELAEVGLSVRIAPGCGVDARRADAGGTADAGADAGSGAGSGASVADAGSNVRDYACTCRFGASRWSSPAGAVPAAGTALAELLDSEGVLDPEGGLVSFLAHLEAPLTDGAAETSAARPVTVARRPVQLRTQKGEWLPQPMPSVWGIPIVPMSEQSLSFLGGRAAMRAMADRVKPVLTIGKIHDLSRLVRSRLGRSVLERLVEPLVRERYGTGADEVDVAIVAPGLNEALTRAGSLSGAALDYEERDVARETAVRPAGGWSGLREAILDRLSLYNVQFTGTPLAVRPDAARLSDAGGTAWLVTEGLDATVPAHALLIEDRGGIDAHIDGASEALADLVPSADGLRLHACVEVTAPDIDPGSPALQTVTLGDGEQWSVRLEFMPSRAVWLARVSGPRSTADAANTHGVEAVLEAVGLTGVRADASRLAMRLATAPYRRIADRDARQAALGAWRDTHRSLLSLGSGLHGDDLGAAVADARAESVSLRRRLTGIAD